MTRSDHVYACNHPVVDNIKNKVVMMEGQEWGGVSDRHTIFHIDDVEKVLNVQPWLLEQNFTSKKDIIWNPERVLLRYYKSQNMYIQKIPRIAFTFKSINDTSRWSNVNSPLAACRNGYIKYMKEYNKTINTCGCNPCLEDC